VWLALAYITTGEGGEKSSMGRGTSAIHGVEWKLSTLLKVGDETDAINSIHAEKRTVRASVGNSDVGRSSRGAVGCCSVLGMAGALGSARSRGK
jgi:hypothetical protein